MRALVDSSALYALTIAEDLHHEQAVGCFEGLERAEAAMATTNYVLLECAALIQRRYGLTQAQALLKKVEGWLDILWIGSREHQEAMTTWTSAGRRELSLVDCASFVAMRRHGIRCAVAFDPHFAQAGFEVLPRADRVAEAKGTYRTTRAKVHKR